MATIMIVDDEVMITKTLAVLLNMKTKQRVITFNNPKEALTSEILINQKVDVIVSDFIMPYMNGIEFLLEVQKISPNTESILLTGYADKENAIRSINEVGVYYYLEKPWNNEELVKIVNNALDKKFLNDSLSKKIEELEQSNQENKRLYELVSMEYDQEIENTKSLILSLANVIEAKDVYTDGHTRRVSQISRALGDAFQLEKRELEILEIAGIVHDIGKVGIPEQILNKTGRLEVEEFELMKTHTVMGEKICMPLNSFRDYLDPIRHHHEKLDGSGYPDGLQGAEISFVTRIISVVDIFDALYSDRPYRLRLPLEKVKVILHEEAGAGYIDAKIVTKLLELVDKGALSEYI